MLAAKKGQWLLDLRNDTRDSDQKLAMRIASSLRSTSTQRTNCTECRMVARRACSKKDTSMSLHPIWAPSLLISVFSSLETRPHSD